MCGRLNVIDDPGVVDLCRQLDIDLSVTPIKKGRFIRATDTLSIIRQTASGRELTDAKWWLLQDKTEEGFKPSKYTSFNSRYDKLNQPRSAAYQPFRTSRCIIPVSGFGETEFENKKAKHYFDFFANENEAIALAGLYKTWYHPNYSEPLFSCSVITLPPHPKLAHIHSKAMPMILPQQGNWMDMWLQHDFADVAQFEPLLAANLPQSLWAQQIDKPSSYQGLSEKLLIEAD